MIQSLTRRDDLAELFAGYGLVVVDERHHLPAVSFDKVVRQAPSRYRLGLTATPYRRDRLEVIISLQCGPVRYEIAPTAVEEAVLLHREDRARHGESDRRPDLGIQDIFRTLVEDEQRIDHITCLADRLASLGHEPLVLRGGLGKKARASVAAAMGRHRRGEGVVVIATGSYLGEGFDWPALDTLL